MEETNTDFPVYSSHAVANAFLELAAEKGKKLTNMQLQKLVYIAHGYTLAFLGRSLYEDRIFAWPWGPVIPRLYKPLQKYGRGVITENLEVDGEEIPAESKEMDIIRGIFRNYGHLKGIVLSRLTHRKSSPWDITWNEMKFSEIPTNRIKNYYQRFL